MFPTDPNGPDGPDRSEYVQRDYAGRRRLRLFTFAPPRPAGGSGWPPVRQLTPLGSATQAGSDRSAA